MSKSLTENVNPEALARLQAALAEFRSELESDAGKAASQAAMEALVRIASSIDHSEWEVMVGADPSLREDFPRLGSLYGGYIFQQEVVAAEAFFESIAQSGRFDHEALTPWGVSAFQRMRDLFDHVDFSACRHLIMVGSGPLPVTLIHVHERTTIPRLTSVDVDPAASAAILRLQRDLGWDRLRATTRNGLEVDYADADAVYLANLISPKREILQRVAEQVAPGTPIIVRDPAGAGDLFAERSVVQLPPGLRQIHCGGGDDRFLSRNIFLVKEG